LKDVYSPTELRELGKGALDDIVAREGRDTNPRWRRDVGTVIDSIRSAAEYRDHPVTWEIIGDSSVNAAALPGGFMIVNVGLPLFCDEYSRAGTTATAAKNRRYMGCLSAVIGHEFAHLALGHADSIAATVRRRQAAARRNDHNTNLKELVSDSVLMSSLHFERSQELDADRVGSLFSLRAGWEIQDAIDLFVALDSVDRGESSWHDQLTWLMDHPRSSERAALLETFRGRLKLDQRDFDDAIVLINADAMPDSALAMIDRVLKDFPRLPAALHARAVLLANRWMAASSVQQLKVRPSMPAYDARFMTRIRGGDPSLLRDARAALAKAFDVSPHPYTLTDLAVLDAYSGDIALAVRRATLAAQREPDDPAIQNNLGVVLFLAGRVAEARKAFDHAEQLAGDQLTPAIAFNVARAAVAMNDNASAIRLIERYLEFDDASPWGQELAALEQRLPGAKVASAPKRSSAPLSAAPAVAGIRLSMRPAEVMNILGKPDSVEGEGRGVVWEYSAKGILLLIDSSDGLVVIILSSKGAGDIEGVRVGDQLADALKKLGPPTDVGEDGTQQIYVFERGAWRVAFTSLGGTLTELSLRERTR
jgi:predicted Zn-dependent protease